jgi:hypothetical protein
MLLKLYTILYLISWHIVRSSRYHDISYEDLNKIALMLHGKQAYVASSEVVLGVPAAKQVENNLKLFLFNEKNQLTSLLNVIS